MCRNSYRLCINIQLWFIHCSPPVVWWMACFSDVSKSIMKVKMKNWNNKTVTFKAEMVFKGHTQDETSYREKRGQQQANSVMRQSAATLNLWCWHSIALRLMLIWNANILIITALMLRRWIVCTVLHLYICVFACRAAECSRACHLF